MTNELTPSHDNNPPDGRFLLYREGETQISVRIEGNTVWLTQRLLAELYNVSVKTINEHLINIYDEGELLPEATIRKFRIVQMEGNRQVSRLVEHYSLETILAVGYRVRSPQGTMFRKWATQRLEELLRKGFTMDDQRLKDGRTGGDHYFEELLERIRDIRASERMFYQKITDIYTTSIDYDPRSDETVEFFKNVQNKLHWAIHGHTAAEILYERIDAEKQNMGLTTWRNAPTGPIRKSDVSVAKNVLNEDELRELNRVVTMYLDYAEDQARQHIPMHMRDWTEKLGDFLRFTGRNVLEHAGKISHEMMLQKVHNEYEKYDIERHRLLDSQPSDFDRLVNETQKQSEKRKHLPKKKRQDDETDLH